MTYDVFGLLGTTIDNRYRVDDVIGEGGFGVVYKGFHLGFGHPIAVKCLKVPSHFTPEAKNLFHEKFREEGAFLSRLSEHPSIVRVFDLNLTPCPYGGKVPYLVLEWLDGAELEATMLEARKQGRPPMSEADAVALMRPAVDAIALAHTMKIAHRDLKPANLYQARTARGLVLKVLDFGIAKAMQEGETATQLATRTTSGFSAFSPQYGAPEQFRTKKFGATGPWTDVYALGLILSELASGQAAYEGDEQADYYEGAMAEQRPTPRARGAKISDAFEALVAKALALAPKERFQDAGELLEAMVALGSLGGGGREAQERARSEGEARPKGQAEVLAKAPSRQSWMTAYGQDEAGTWATASIAGVDVKFRFCPPGRFIMGSPETEEGRSGDEGPQHEVELTRGFWLGETVVTQRLWQAVIGTNFWQALMGNNPSTFKGPERPVECVSWDHCAGFLGKANGSQRGLDVRLPTEAEWEYACRAGTTGPTYRGVNDAKTLDAIAWYGANSGRETHPVGQKAANPWGLHDMLGNVWEWCSDWAAAYAAGRTVDPTGPATGPERVARGGSWLHDARYARAAARLAYAPDGQYGALGFRLARGQ